MGCDGVHVHAVADHRDRISGSHERGQENVLDVVDDIDRGRRVGVPRHVGIVARQNVVAEEHIAGVEISDDEIQVVDQLGAGDGIAGRIGPDQGEA